MSTNPTADDWKEAVDSLKLAPWDPGFEVDDDGRLYTHYFGSSNTHAPNPGDRDKQVHQTDWA